jgi:hypothetical protein
MSQPVAQDQPQGGHGSPILHWMPALLTVGWMFYAVPKGCNQDMKIERQQRDIEAIKARQAERDTRPK